MTDETVESRLQRLIDGYMAEATRKPGGQQTRTKTPREIFELVAFDLKALLRDLLAAPAAPGWQPIATAPKVDGELVLLHPSRCWSADAEPYDCEVGYWDDHAQTWCAQGPGADDYAGPTHWMPCPPLRGRPLPPRSRSCRRG